MFVKYICIIISALLLSPINAQQNKKQKSTETFFDASSSNVQNSFNKKILQSFQKVKSTKAQANEKLKRFERIEESRKIDASSHKISTNLYEDKLKTQPVNILTLIRSSNEINNPLLLSIDRKILIELISGLTNHQTTLKDSLDDFITLFQKTLSEDYDRYTKLKEQIENALWTEEITYTECIHKLTEIYKFDLECSKIDKKSIENLAKKLAKKLCSEKNDISFQDRSVSTDTLSSEEKINFGNIIDRSSSSIKLNNILTFSRSDLAKYVLLPDEFAIYTASENRFRGKKQKEILKEYYKNWTDIIKQKIPILAHNNINMLINNESFWGDCVFFDHEIEKDMCLLSQKAKDLIICTNFFRAKKDKFKNTLPKVSSDTTNFFICECMNWVQYKEQFKETSKDVDIDVFKYLYDILEKPNYDLLQ